MDTISSVANVRPGFSMASAEQLQSVKDIADAGWTAKGNNRTALDELMAVSRPLSAVEVKSLYRRGYAPDPDHVRLPAAADEFRELTFVDEATFYSTSTKRQTRFHGKVNIVNH